MTPLKNVLPTSVKPLRLWPGVVFAVLQLFAWFVLPVVLPEAGFFGVLGAAASGLGILLWWLFFSRVPWRERLGMLLLFAVALFVASRLLHVSVATAGMGLLFYFFAVPLVSLMLVLGAAIGRGMSSGARQAVTATAILLASAGWTLVRFEGVGGGIGFNYAWRWSPTAEERLLAQAKDEPKEFAAPATAATEAPAKATETPASQPAEKQPASEVANANAAAITAAEWPGFRGPERNSIAHVARIETNWTASPPQELWRRPIGPGWSSFAVRGDLLYTQEQRGEEEIVACYNLKTGKPVWMHSDATRFWEANAGAGPRGTPTLAGARVYTFGATGIVNALDAATGAVMWSRNAATDTGEKTPYWGFASSPLVTGDLVIVAAAGSLVAYDIASGEPRWFGPKGGTSYSSPHRVTIGGVEQILLMSKGLTSVAPADGKVLWQHEWPGFTMVQPSVTADGDILISDENLGIRRLSVTQSGGTWTVQERWTSIGLKPYFNDYVVHKGHAFGFDGRILSCIDLQDGVRKWKGGRYGNGQMVLLAEQDLLLVLTEEGELALVSATFDQFSEVARFPVIEGKTWNHPALAGDVLLVRNDREMAAFRLPRAASKAAAQPGAPAR